MSIRDEADREVDAYRGKESGLVLLIPEDRWQDFLRETQTTPGGDPPEVAYRGVQFRSGPVTAVIAQEGF